MKITYASPNGYGRQHGRLVDNDAAREASQQEIIRRYYQTILDFAGRSAFRIYRQNRLLMNETRASHRQAVTVAARAKAESTGEPALELPNGEIVTGKTSELLGPTAVVLINAIKKLAYIGLKKPS